MTKTKRRSAATMAVQTRRLKERYGLIKSAIESLNFRAPFQAEFTTELFKDSFYRKMSLIQKLNYLQTCLMILKPIKDDYHIGDQNFQAQVISGAPEFVRYAGSIYSDEYLELGLDRDDRAIKFDGLVESVLKSSSNYTFPDLCTRVAEYQLNQVRANDSMDYDLGKRTKPQNYVAPLPVSKMAQVNFHNHMVLYEYGFNQASKLPAELQTLLLEHSLPPLSNSGYPYGQSQHAGMFVPWSVEYIRRQAPRTYRKHKELLTRSWKEWVDRVPINEVGDDLSIIEQFNNPPEDAKMRPRKGLITVDIIKDMVIELDETENYPPFYVFYRTQKDKVRAVFGGPWPEKMRGCMQHLVGLFAYTQEAGEKHGIKMCSVGSPEKPKWLPAGGEFDLPFLGQGEGDAMFSKFQNVMQSLVNEDGDLPEGLDIIGDDLSGYDMTITWQCMEWMKQEESYSWNTRTLLNMLKNSRCWLGPYVIWKCYWTSGHSFTSNGGSFVHDDILFMAISRINKKRRDYNKAHPNAEPLPMARVLHRTFLSDDSFVILENCTVKEIAEEAEICGFTIKVKDSYSYNKHKCVTFLKVDIGRIFKSKSIYYCGNSKSRYYNLCHSERDLETEMSRPQNLRRHDPGTPVVTGDVMVDSHIGKLGSWSVNGQPFVIKHLEATWGTRLTQDTMMAITRMSEISKVTTYREDVSATFRSEWLQKLPMIQIATHKPIT
jgi:hypothetical protein